jgi:hypothetical protein
LIQWAENQAYKAKEEAIEDLLPLLLQKIGGK